MSKVHRYTISLTAAILRRMRSIGRAVNWSFVAREAFERKIDEIDGKKTELDLLREEVERLKAKN